MIYRDTAKDTVSELAEKISKKYYLKTLEFFYCDTFTNIHRDIKVYPNILEYKVYTKKCIEWLL